MKQPNYYKITKIIGKTHDSSYGGYPWKIEVTIDVCAKEWTKLRNKDDLGSLYGIDVGNAVYKINPDIPAYCPSVDHDKRAKNGVKTVKLVYYINDADKAERLGFKVKRLRNGEAYANYSDFVDLLEKSA